jgi:hypothetical protein
VGVFFLFSFALGVALMEALVCGLSFARVDPYVVIGGLFGEKFAGHNAIHSGVLYVNVEVLAGHGDDNIEVQLEFMADAAFDREMVGFCASPPCS